MLTLALDQDNVLADWDQGLINAWMNDPIQCKRSFIPKEQRSVFYASDDYKDPVDVEFVNRAPRLPGFYENLPVMDGALEAFDYLTSIKNLNVIILTAPMTEHDTCAQEKLAWIRKHLGAKWVNQTFIMKDKTFARQDVLIDDKPVITGMLKPTWTHILYSWNYNKHIPRTRLDWTNYKTVLKPFLSLLE